MAFGENLRRLRREKGMTQGDLAKTVAVWFTAISNIERGESEPSLELAAKLAAALGVTVDELMQQTEPEAPNAAAEAA